MDAAEILASVLSQLETDTSVFSPSCILVTQDGEAISHPLQIPKALGKVFGALDTWSSMRMENCMMYPSRGDGATLVGGAVREVVKADGAIVQHRLTVVLSCLNDTWRLERLHVSLVTPA